MRQLVRVIRVSQAGIAGLLIFMFIGGIGVGQHEFDGVPGHKTRLVRGWTIHLDNALLRAENREKREEGLDVLRLHLARIKRSLKKKRVRQLQKFHIVLDLHHELKSLQYHPEKKWLREHGYHEEMVNMVHIPRVNRFTSRKLFVTQPMVLLHELAHAYHDQVLGFDNGKIKSLYDRVRASGKLEKVLNISGSEQRHYALKDKKEFFAEMTEAYLGTNDFYPFVSAELKSELPEVYAFMRNTWGPVP